MNFQQNHVCTLFKIKNFFLISTQVSFYLTDYVERLLKNYLKKLKTIYR